MLSAVSAVCWNFQAASKDTLELEFLQFRRAAGVAAAISPMIATSPRVAGADRAVTTVRWPPVFARKAACARGYSLCVSVKHGRVVVSEWTPDGSQLNVHSLADGSLVRSIGSKGSGEGQFNFYYGGLCVSADGDSVLVAECNNNRVQQLKIVDGSWVRFVGEGVLRAPQFVDCTSTFMAVSESDSHRISVLSWRDGRVLAHFGSEGSGPGQLRYPRGLRLLADGSGVVVADQGNHRLCVFRLSGEFVTAIGSKEQGVSSPLDVLECDSDGSFLVANFDKHYLAKFSHDGSVVGVHGKQGVGNGEFKCPSALAALPDGGLVVREDRRFQVFADSPR
jgi:DNA-binding beta-propeller fold protein YncE